MFSDISARKRAELGMAAARVEAEKANRAKDEFLAMLGHELRNPLAPMLTALQCYACAVTIPREQDVLERQVRHLAGMVDDLLDVSRITRGKLDLKGQPIELCPSWSAQWSSPGRFSRSAGTWSTSWFRRRGWSQRRPRTAGAVRQSPDQCGQVQRAWPRILVRVGRRGDFVRYQRARQGAPRPGP